MRSKAVQELAQTERRIEARSAPQEEVRLRTPKVASGSRKTGHRRRARTRSVQVGGEPVLWGQDTKCAPRSRRQPGGGAAEFWPTSQNAQRSGRPKAPWGRSPASRLRSGWASGFKAGRRPGRSPSCSRPTGWNSEPQKPLAHPRSGPEGMAEGQWDAPRARAACAGARHAVRARSASAARRFPKESDPALADDPPVAEGQGVIDSHARRVWGVSDFRER